MSILLKSGDLGVFQCLSKCPSSHCDAHHDHPKMLHLICCISGVSPPNAQRQTQKVWGCPVVPGHPSISTSHGCLTGLRSGEFGGQVSALNTWSAHNGWISDAFQGGPEVSRQSAESNEISGDIHLTCERVKWCSYPPFLLKTLLCPHTPESKPTPLTPQWKKKMLEQRE